MYGQEKVDKWGYLIHPKADALVRSRNMRMLNTRTKKKSFYLRSKLGY